MVRNTPPDAEVRYIGHCVYCSNDGSSEKLTDEHIIPLSFGGYQYLGAASCRQCRDETHAFEGQCCNTMFKALRVHRAIRTRRPKKRPTHLPVLVGVTPHGAPFEEIPVDHAPEFAQFPIFGPPLILTNEYSFDRVDYQGAVVCLTTKDAKARQQQLQAEGRPGALAYAEIPLGQFMRALAKIAHCYVASQVGLNGFRPLLQDVILGREHPPYYVGGKGSLPLFVPDPGPNAGHQIYAMTLTIREVDYIAAQIRLFSDLRPVTPIYLIIVGEYSASKSNPHPIFLGQKNFYAQTIKSFAALIEPAPI